MAKKCTGCGAPLDGFFAKIARLAGVKPSATNPDVCNKCENKMPKAEDSADQAPAPEAPKTEEPVPEVSVEPTPEAAAPAAPEAPVEESTPAEPTPAPEAPAEPAAATEAAPAPEKKEELPTAEPEDILAGTDEPDPSQAQGDTEKANT